MKHIVSVVLLLCLLLPLGAMSVFAEGSTGWQVQQFVDDFGDPTDDAYLSCAVSGTFSNTATSGETLYVLLCYDPGSGMFSIRLNEYGDINRKATYTDNDSKVIKIKIDDEITEGILVGKAPNGDLMLTGGLCLFKIHDAFLNGQTVRFIIEIGSSKYSFSVDGLGFSTCLGNYLATAQVKTDGINYDGTNFHKLERLVSINYEGQLILSSFNVLYTIAISQQEENISGGKHYHYEIEEISPRDEKYLGDNGYADYLKSGFESNIDSSLNTLNNRVYYDGYGNRLWYEASFGKHSFSYDIYIEYAK